MQCAPMAAWPLEHWVCAARDCCCCIAARCLTGCLARAQGSGALAAAVKSGIRDSSWGQLLAGVCAAAHAWEEGRAGSALDAQLTALTLATEVTEEAETNWTVPALQIVASDAFAVAVACFRGEAEFADETRAERCAVLERLAQSLRFAFATTAAHRLAGLDRSLSKKHGTLAIGLLMLRTYTLLRNTRVCVTMVRSIEGPGSLPLSSFPKHQVVPYNFFRGRIAVFQGDLLTARQSLEFALANTPSTARFHRNRCRIMAVLVPVMLHFGRVASPEALARFGLRHYAPLLDAFVAGHLGRFHAAIDANRAVLVRTGVFITLERLGQAVLRNLIARALPLAGGKSIVDLSIVRAALAHVGAASSQDAAECALAGLIRRGFIKGYISHSHGKMVVATKSSALPRAAFNGSQ